jgi:hypothetical protein
MTTLLAGAAIAFALWRIGTILEERQRRSSVQQLLATFASAAAAVQHDPQKLLAWYPLVRTSRALFPDAFKDLDAASGGSFPFTREQIQNAHSRCTAEWLAWERAHDAEYSVKTAEVQDVIDRSSATPLLRTRLAALEQQKLALYQQRYEEYIKTAKALAALAE